MTQTTKPAKKATPAKTTRSERQTRRSGDSAESKASGCKIENCTKPATTRGLCDGHWMSRRGDADPKTKD